MERVLGFLKEFRIPPTLLTGVELAKNLAEALPDRNSTPIQAMLRTVNSINVVRTTLSPEKANGVTAYVERHNLQKIVSDPFVRLFFDTELHKRFSISLVRVSDYQTIADARGPLGRFAFIKYDYADDYETTFYCAAISELPGALEGLWEEYGGGIHVSVIKTPTGMARIAFSRLSSSEDALYGKTSDKLKDLLERHRRFIARDVPRAYMFYGPPGTGKTSFALHFASGSKVLKLDAGSFAVASVRDMSFLLDNLRPEFLLVDDVDKVEVGNALPSLLETLQAIKVIGDCTVMLTANRVDGFDTGLLRPGRVDTWVEFALPDWGDRFAVLGRYNDQLEAGAGSEDLRILSDESEGLSQDYLRELILEFRNSRDLVTTVRLIRTMKRLLQTASSGAPGSSLNGVKAPLKPA